MSKHITKIDSMKFIDQMLTQISNSKEMLAALQRFAITPDNISELKEHFNQTAALFEVQNKELGDQLQATSNYKQLWQEVAKTYSATLKIARIVFRDHLDAAQTLLLNGERKTSLPDWYIQAKTFYNGLLNNGVLLERMQKYNYFEKEIRIELEQVERAYATYLAQKTETAEAVQATEDRDRSFDELYQKAMDLKTIVKLAFNGRSEWLVAVGL